MNSRVADENMSEFSLRRRSSAILQYLGSMSMPTLLRPDFNAATIVAPDPQKGSMTVSPEKKNILNEPMRRDVVLSVLFGYHLFLETPNAVT